MSEKKSMASIPEGFSLEYFTFPLAESCRAGDALRLTHTGVLQLLRQGDGMNVADFVAVEDGAAGEPVRCIHVKPTRVKL